MPVKSKEWDLGTRVSVLALWASGAKPSDLCVQFEMSLNTFKKLRSKAQQRGWKRGDPVLIEHVENAPRKGRSLKVVDDLKAQILSLLERNHTTRGYSTRKLSILLANTLADEGVQVSRSTIYRFLKRQAYKSVKSTVKCGLNNTQKRARLRWALAHQDWTIEDWKRIVWSDETSIILGSLRGKRRIWRKAKQAFLHSCIRRRWKGRQEFMFWACFCWNQKGPYYVWPKESAQRTRRYKQICDRYNQRHESADRQTWEASEAIRVTGLKRRPSRPKQWKYTEETGAMVRKGKKGNVDWMRYQYEVLRPRYLPFMKRLGIDYLAQEDNAPAYRGKWNKRLWDA